MIWLLLFLPTAKALTKCYDIPSKLQASHLGISASEFQYSACPSHQFCKNPYSELIYYGGTPDWYARDESGDNGIVRFQTDDINCNYLTNTGPCDSSIQITDSSFSPGTGLISTYTGSGSILDAAKVSCGKHPECFWFQYVSGGMQFMTNPWEPDVVYGPCPLTDPCLYNVELPSASYPGDYILSSSGSYSNYFLWSICIDRPTCTEGNLPDFRKKFNNVKITGPTVTGLMCDLDLTAVEASKTDLLCTDICTTTECCGDPVGKTCSSWEECGLTHDCIDGTCHKIKYKCSSDADCMTGDKCVDDGSSAFTFHQGKAYFAKRTHRQFSGTTTQAEEGTIYKYLLYNTWGEPYTRGMVSNAFFPDIPLSNWKLSTASLKQYSWMYPISGITLKTWYQLQTNANDMDDLVSQAKAKCDEIDCTFFIVMVIPANRTKCKQFSL